jgi:hypothetical protein
LLVATSNYKLRFEFFKSSFEIFEIFLKKCKKKSKPVCVEAGELKFCRNMLYYECFIAWFSDFEVLDICGGFMEKTNSQVCNMWKVETRAISASEFLTRNTL